MGITVLGRFLNRVGIVLAAVALAGLTLSGTGCAFRGGDPNAAQYHFPEEGSATAGQYHDVSAAQPASSGSPVQMQPAGAALLASTTLRVGDMISVSFSDTPAPGLQEIRARIPGDGMLTLHHNVRVKAAGQTIPDLEREIRAAFVPRLYRNLTAIVRADERFFYVGGEVKLSGRFALQGDMTVLKAIDSAGGFTEFANRKKIDLRRPDGTTVRLSEKKIRNGEQVDLPVMANDHITVGKRWW